MELGVCLSEKESVSLDELVIKVRELFETKGMAGVVTTVLGLLDDLTCEQLRHGQAHPLVTPCCLVPRYEYHGRRARRVRSSCGRLHMHWHRMRCQCGKTVVPLRSVLRLVPCQPKTNELERLVIDVVAEQSYRRGSRHLREIGGVPVPRSTEHRWVAQSLCDDLPAPGATLDVLMADGTGFKRRPQPEEKITNRGEVRVALGITRGGETVPVGAWTDRTWEEISKLLERPAGEPLAHVLGSDGERGIAEHLARLTGTHQRCHWHQVNDVNYTLWEDKAPREERRAYQRQLAGMIGIELPAEDFDRVKDADKSALTERVARAETELSSLAAELQAKGYEHTSRYIEYAKERLFSYVRFWLQTGIAVPKVTSKLERLMREIGRRLKRIAFGWSDAGAAKMTRIIIKRIVRPADWKRYWEERYQCSGTVSISLKGVYAV